MTNGPDQDCVNLGFGGALGFSASDLVSPAAAASDEFALPDRGLDEPQATELRIHGVSGSNGPTMLEHPDVIQVAGDSSTMFYRRWNPAGAGGVAVKWKLEAYSWGGLTEKPLAAASWILLAPFMLFNVAHFALPVEDVREPVSVKGNSAAKYLPRSRTRRAAQALLRL